MTTDTAEILDPANYTVAWIAPLFIEAQAALLMLDKRHRGNFRSHRGNDYLYLAGEINSHNVVIATFPPDHDYGVGSAAALASQVKIMFPRLWFGLLVGVAAGIPNFDKGLDIRLGDVLVGVGDNKSAGLISYGLRRQTNDGFELIRHGSQARSETIVRSAIGSLKLIDFDALINEEPLTFLKYYEPIKKRMHVEEIRIFADPGQEMDKLYQTRDSGGVPTIQQVERDIRPDNRRTKVFYGSIGSGDTLMRNAAARDELRDKYNIIGLEMEAAGIQNHLNVGVIRGVCDYGDEHKDDKWQPYAAIMAAAYAKAILHQIKPHDRGETENSDSYTTGQAQQERNIILNVKPKHFPSTLPSYFNNSFSGRKEELAWIGEIFEKSPPLQQRACLFGLGAIGKSEIAFEYARRCSVERCVFWIKASTADNLELGYTAIGHKLIPNFQSQKGDILKSVKEYLERTESLPWLMVFDGADDTQLFFGNKGKNYFKYIPQACHGQILITTRDDQIFSLAGGQLVFHTNGRHVLPMTIQDGTELFQKFVRPDKRALHVQILAPQGAIFLDMLGGLPLAIIQATTYMLCENITIKDFIDIYRTMEERERIYENPASDMEKGQISVLYTWEISYRRIAETPTPGLKSQAAMLLDLLGFIDSKSSPILRKLSEAEFVFKDIEGPSPLDGLREISREVPSLEDMCKIQNTPRGFIFSVFQKRFAFNMESDFKSAIGKLQRYSLIDEECWVHPVVHDWIFYRLTTEEKKKYIQWLIQELWLQLIINDDSGDRLQNYLLPPKYCELVFHELPHLRHARVVLNHAISKTTLDSISEASQGEYYSFHREAVDLLYWLGRMLASASKAEEGIYYLQKSIENMEYLVPPLLLAEISERRLVLAKSRFRVSYRSHNLPDAVAEARSLSDQYHTNEAALWLAQCLQISGELEDAAAIFQRLVNDLSIYASGNPLSDKVIFAAYFGAATTLATLSNTRSRDEARILLDNGLLPYLGNLNDDDALKVLIYPDALVCRLGLVTDPQDRETVIKMFMDHDATTFETSLTGGNQLQWSLQLGELINQSKWSAIEILGEAFIKQRRNFKEIWSLRHKIYDESVFNQLLVEIDAWIAIHVYLGTAYFKLERLDQAERAHLDALGLCLGLSLFPEQINADLFEQNLCCLQRIFVKQRKDRIYQLVLSYLGSHIKESTLREYTEE